MIHTITYTATVTAVAKITTLTTVLIKNGNQSRVTAKNMTERQYKALSWHLWRYGAKWKPATVDELKKLDNITASDIIQLFDNGMIDSAICQLKHLDIEV